MPIFIVSKASASLEDCERALAVIQTLTADFQKKESLVQKIFAFHITELDDIETVGPNGIVRLIKGVDNTKSYFNTKSPIYIRHCISYVLNSAIQALQQRIQDLSQNLNTPLSDDAESIISYSGNFITIVCDFSHSFVDREEDYLGIDVSLPKRMTAFKFKIGIQARLKKGNCKWNFATAYPIDTVQNYDIESRIS